MEVNEIITLVGTILSALFAGMSFTFYKKTIKVNGDYIKKIKEYQNINQKAGNNGKNIIGDNNNI